MKKYWIVIFAACLLVTGCNEKKPQEQVSVVHLDPGKATVSVTPSVEATQTPVPTNTPSPTPEPTSTPIPTNTVTPTVIPSVSPSDVKEDLPTLINQYRESNGMPPLTQDESLNLCAAVRLAEMTGTGLSHTRPDGTDFGTVFETYGVTGKEAVELAYESKQMTAMKAFDAFTVSKENCSALLGEWTGIGVALDGNKAVLLLIR